MNTCFSSIVRTTQTPTNEEAVLAHIGPEVVQPPEQSAGRDTGPDSTHAPPLEVELLVELAQSQEQFHSL